jgi:hypothetical protein
MLEQVDLIAESSIETRVKLRRVRYSAHLPATRVVYHACEIRLVIHGMRPQAGLDTGAAGSWP